MKTFSRIALCGLLLLAGASISFAAYTADKSEVHIASAVVTGTPIATLTALVKNISDNAETDQLNWTNIQVGVSTWSVSQQYVQLQYDANQAGWGIQIRTGNQEDGADPTATGTTDDDITGLIGVTDTSKNAALGWEVYDSTSDYDSTIWGIPAAGNDWFYVSDSSQTTYDVSDPANLDYMTIVNSSGLKHDVGREAGSSPIYVYMEANFTTAEMQTYRTNKLYFILYHQ